MIITGFSLIIYVPVLINKSPLLMWDIYTESLCIAIYILKNNICNAHCTI